MSGIQPTANWANHIAYFNSLILDLEQSDNDNAEIRRWKQMEQASARAMIEIVYELQNLPEFSSLSVRRSFHSLTLHAVGTDFILSLGAPEPEKGVYVIAADDLDGADIPEMRQQLSRKDIILLLRNLFEVNKGLQA
jgi:hypothetical protein